MAPLYADFDTCSIAHDDAGWSKSHPPHQVPAHSVEGLLKTVGNLRLERMAHALPPEPNPLRQSHRLNLLVQAIERTAGMARRGLTDMHVIQLRERFFNQLGINGCCGQ